MSSLGNPRGTHVQRHTSVKPTGVPEDAVEAATAINEQIGRLVNRPGPDKVGILLMPGRGDEMRTLALVSLALSATDIAASLRVLAARTQG